MELDIHLQQVAERLATELATAGLTVTAAESCTGGLVAAALTSVPGSSDWFEQSWVTYSNQAKQSLLGVADALLLEHGAVSREVVEAMAVGAQQKAASAISVAISGIAGPGGGSEEKPVGTVWIAWASADDVQARCFHYNGDRSTVRMRAAVDAIIGCEDKIRLVSL